MPIKFSERFADGWKTDVIQSTPIVTPTLPVSLTFPSSYFNNIDLYDDLVLPTASNLRVPGGNNSTFYSAGTYPNTKLSSLDGLYLGEIALYAGALAHTGARTPNFEYRPIKKPGVTNSFIWVDDQNFWVYQTYNFALSSFSVPVETDIGYDLIDTWDYRAAANPTEFSTDTGTLGISESIFTINKLSMGLDLTYKLPSMYLSGKIQVDQGANVWQYTIITWTDAGTQVQIGVTLLSGPPTAGPTGPFVIKFSFTSIGSVSNHAGYIWGELTSTQRFYVSPNYPMILFDLDPPAGTSTTVGWWDFNSSTTIQRNLGYQWDRQTIAAIPFEDTSGYVTMADPYVIATFVDGGNYSFQIMNQSSGAVTQANTGGHEFVKTIPKCQKNSNYSVYVVGYGNSSDDGITIYEILNGTIIGTYNDDLIGSPGCRINQIEFTGIQYEQGVGQTPVIMYASTNNGEYKIEWNPSSNTITKTSISSLITAFDTKIMIKCSPFGDPDGIFLMNKPGTGLIYWNNLNSTAGFAPISGNLATGTYSGRTINDIVRKSDFDGNQFGPSLAGSGWLLASGPNGSNGGSHYIPGSTGTQLSAYKEDPTGTNPSRIFTSANDYHTVTWIKDPVNPDEAIILGDSNSAFWKVFPLFPIA